MGHDWLYWDSREGYAWSDATPEEWERAARARVADKPLAKTADERATEIWRALCNRYMSRTQGVQAGFQGFVRDQISEAEQAAIYAVRRRVADQLEAAGQMDLAHRIMNDR